MIKIAEPVISDSLTYILNQPFTLSRKLQTNKFQFCQQSVTLWNGFCYFCMINYMIIPGGCKLIAGNPFHVGCEGPEATMFSRLITVCTVHI